MSPSVASALSIVLSIIVTVVGIVFFLPPKNKDKFGKAFSRFHDFFNFKTLIVDYVLKGLYILSTAMCIIGGFFTIFTVRTYYTTTGTMFNSSSEAHTSLSVENLGTGLLIMILGPILVRIIYELIMLTIVGVKNIIEINKKMDCCKGEESKTETEEPTFVEEPTVSAPVEPEAPNDTTTV